MPATRPIDELRREAAALIIARIKKTTVAKAASELEVSRQALYDIQEGKYCPSLALIYRACEVWGLEFNFRGLAVNKRGLKRRPVPRSQPSQTSLVFEALELVAEQQLDGARARRVGK